MKDLVFAVISICLSSGHCETHQVKVEPKVCHLRQVQARSEEHTSELQSH